jgi:hypothetical protein
MNYPAVKSGPLPVVAAVLVGSSQTDVTTNTKTCDYSRRSDVVVGSRRTARIFFDDFTGGMLFFSTMESQLRLIFLASAQIHDEQLGFSHFFDGVAKSLAS